MPVCHKEAYTAYTLCSIIMLWGNPSPMWILFLMFIPLRLYLFRNEYRDDENKP